MRHAEKTRMLNIDSGRDGEGIVRIGGLEGGAKGSSGQAWITASHRDVSLLHSRDRMLGD